MADAGPKTIPPFELALAALLMVAVYFVASWQLQLTLQRDLVVAGARCTVQLLLLGYVLLPIFRLDNPVLNLVWTAVMAALAGWEAAGRPAMRYAQMWRHAMAAVVASAFITVFWAVFAVLRVGLQAQYLIPLMGMMLGNTSSAVAIALGSVTVGLSEGAAAVEQRLALGATRWEATQATLRAGVNLGLTPTLNAMAIMGIVSIPGMMTGQILGGTPPSLAALYQIVIMYLISTSACLSVVLAAAAAVHSCTDNEHRLHVDSLFKKPKGSAGTDPLSRARRAAEAAAEHAAAYAASKAREAASGAVAAVRRLEARRRGAAISDEAYTPLAGQ